MLRATQLVLRAYLPSSGITTEEGKVSLEPVVDLIERQLSGRGLIDRLTDEGSVGEGRPDVSQPVELSVLAHLRLHVQTAGPVHFIGAAQGIPSPCKAQSGQISNFKVYQTFRGF